MSFVFPYSVYDDNILHDEESLDFLGFNVENYHFFPDYNLSSLLYSDSVPEWPSPTDDQDNLIPTLPLVPPPPVQPAFIAPAPNSDFFLYGMFVLNIF